MFFIKSHLSPLPSSLSPFSSLLLSVVFRCLWSFFLCLVLLSSLFPSVLRCHCFCCCFVVAAASAVAARVAAGRRRSCCCCWCCWCFSFRVDCSSFLFIFSVIQAIAEKWSGTLCAARCGPRELVITMMDDDCSINFLTSSLDLPRVCNFCTIGRGVDWAV